MSHPSVAPVQIGDISVHPMTFDSTIEWIADRVSDNKGAVVCTPNADYVVRARRDRFFRAAIEAADLRVPDGMAIIYAAQIAGRPLKETVTGRLLVPAVAGRAAQCGWPIALYGSSPDVASEAASRLRSRYPDLAVVEALSPPMGLVIGAADDQDAVSRLRASGARVVFVALGAPRQEQWMNFYRDRLPGVVLVGVGAALDIIAGRFREAPRWMTRLGLEWLFRLAQEPHRLARRYLADDPWIFVWAVRTRLGLAGAVDWPNT